MIEKSAAKESKDATHNDDEPSSSVTTEDAESDEMTSLMPKVSFLDRMRANRELQDAKSRDEIRRVFSKEFDPSLSFANVHPSRSFPMILLEQMSSDYPELIEKALRLLFRHFGYDHHIRTIDSN